jgi:Methyltransferase domain
MPYTLLNERPFFQIPLGYESVLQPRSGDFVYEEVRRRIDQDLPSISKTLADLSPLAVHEALADIPLEQIDDTTPYWHNPFFSGGDGRYACAFAAHFVPAKILEVGSGNSTKFFRHAINKFGLNTRICCIDPAPRADVTSVADDIITETVLTVNLSLFDSLASNDILFWDGSHLTLNGSDVIRLFLEIVPRLREGVLLHLHDIQLPFEYNETFSDRGYAEQYMLAVYLLNSGDTKILLPLYYLYRVGGIKHGGVSFWMRVGKRVLRG